jgi:hypothetical protein
MAVDFSVYYQFQGARSFKTGQGAKIPMGKEGLPLFHVREIVLQIFPVIGIGCNAGRRAGIFHNNARGMYPSAFLLRWKK